MGYKHTIVKYTITKHELERITDTYLVRHEKGLTPLKLDNELNKSAKFRCEAMIFDNTLSSRGWAIIRNQALRDGLVEIDENISWGYTYEDAAKKLSKNIELKDWEYTGIAVVKRQRLRFYICQIFAK